MNHNHPMSSFVVRTTRRASAEAQVNLSKRRAWHMPYSAEFT